MPRFGIFRDELHEFHEIQYLALKSMTSLEVFSRPCHGVTFCDILCKARVKIIDQLLQSAVVCFLLSKKCRVGLVYIITDCMAQI